MKKIIPIMLCLILLSCREETIPVVSVTTLPAELVGLGDTIFDTVPYLYEEIKRTVVPPDSIVFDTIRIDTFYVDTFFVDTIRLCGTVSYEGDEPYGPALQEYGFCVNEHIYYSVSQTTELKTPADSYGAFSYVMEVRNTDRFYVHAYVINPFGQIRGATRLESVSDFDSR